MHQLLSSIVRWQKVIHQAGVFYEVIDCVYTKKSLHQIVDEAIEIFVQSNECNNG